MTKRRYTAEEDPARSTGLESRSKTESLSK